MGLYTMIFGKNPEYEVLLSSLGLVSEDFYRFRDCYLGEYEGYLYIVVYTRAGASNSDCYCYDPYICDDPAKRTEVDYFGVEHCPGCVELLNQRIEAHPNYRFRADDDYDCTYCSYYFEPPHTLPGLQDMPTEVDRDTLWKSFMDSLKDN